MPHIKRKSGPKRQKKRSGDKFTPSRSIQAIAQTGMIPPFKSVVPQQSSFRFTLGSGVSRSFNFTTTSFLDLYAIAVGGSTSPCRLYNNMKLLRIRLWSNSTVQDTGANHQEEIGIEFHPGTAAGFGGAPRTSYTSAALGPTKVCHLDVRPKKDELAAQWFSAQQTIYTLVNIFAGPAAVIQFDFLATFVNDETPVNVANTCSLAKGTIGVTNFALSGCRSDGLVNLMNP